jgi:hypothetical protein
MGYGVVGCSTSDLFDCYSAHGFRPLVFAKYPSTRGSWCAACSWRWLPDHDSSYRSLRRRSERLPRPEPQRAGLSGRGGTQAATIIFLSRQLPAMLPTICSVLVVESATCIPIGIINALYAWFDSHWTSARLSDHTRVNGLNGRGETDEMQKKYPDSALIQTGAFSVSYRYCR